MRSDRRHAFRVAGFITLLAVLPLDGRAAPRHTPVPGGIAVIALPAGSSGAHFDGTPILITETQGRRQAIVGLALTTLPGQHVLELDDGRGINFTVTDKIYPTQHVRIKDQGKVELSPENEARVVREHAEINQWKQFRSGDADPKHPIPTSLHRPKGHAAAVSAFGACSTDSRARRMSDSTSPSRAAHRSLVRAREKCWPSATISSTAKRFMSITAKG